MERITWLESLEIAMQEAETTGKLVFIFFHDPSCHGSIKTREETFTDKDTSDMIGVNFASVTFNVKSAGELAERYNIEWTPTFVVTDSKGTELVRWVGYLPPIDFACQLMLAKGLADVKMNLLHDAESALSWILDHHPDVPLAPKARYFMGFALYKETGDIEHLKRTWEAMKKRYPESLWTKKASAWAA